MLGKSSELELHQAAPSVLRAVRTSPLEFADQFQQYLWDQEQPERMAVAFRAGLTPILFTAPHAVTHWRLAPGEEDPSKLTKKQTDLYTGPIVATIAAFTEASSMIAVSLDKDDPNHNLLSPTRPLLLTFAQQTQPRYIIDIHGAVANEKFDVVIGTGGLSPDLPRFRAIKAAFEYNELRAQISAEGEYSASGNTLTRFFTEQDFEAVQIEATAPWRNPQKYPYKYLALIQSLILSRETLNQQTQTRFYSFPETQHSTA